MANYSTLKAAIDQYITANGNNEITGTVLNNVLDAMVNSLGANYQFAGVATPSTNPGTPDQNVFYLAMEGGTYTNFNGTVLPAGVSMLMWNGTWTSETVMYGDGGVFDISVYKSSGGTLAKYADLAAALDGGNNIPVGVRKGGMSVKFVQSSDNKYVQYFCNVKTFTTNVDGWEKINLEKEIRVQVSQATNTGNSWMFNDITFEANHRYYVKHLGGYGVNRSLTIGSSNIDRVFEKDKWIEITSPEAGHPYLYYGAEIAGEQPTFAFADITNCFIPDVQYLNEQLIKVSVNTFTGEESSGHNAWLFSTLRVYSGQKYYVKHISGDLGALFVGESISTDMLVNGKWIEYTAPATGMPYIFNGYVDQTPVIQITSDKNIAIGEIKRLDSILDGKEDKVKWTTINVSYDGTSKTGRTIQFSGLNAIANAINSITDASENNRYIIHVEGEFHFTDPLTLTMLGGGEYSAILMKDYIDIEGDGPDKSVVFVDFPANATFHDGKTFNDYQPIYFFGTGGTIRNMKIAGKNCRYSFHIEAGPGFSDKVINVEECTVVSYGAPDYMYQGIMECFGTGIANGQIWNIKNCDILNYYNGDAFAMHTPLGIFQKPPVVNLENCRLMGGMYFGNYQVENVTFINMVGCTFVKGDIPTINYSYYNDITTAVNGDYTTALMNANKMEALYDVLGLHQNDGKGVVLKVVSLSTGVNSKVRFAPEASAFNIIIGNADKAGKTNTVYGWDTQYGYVYRDGGVDLNGQAFGTIDIDEHSSANRSLGKLLGDCTSNNKSLAINVNGTNYTVVFNENYTEKTNAYVIGKINDVIGSVATASVFCPANLYYPSINGLCNVVSADNGAILKGMGIVFTSSGMRKAKNSDGYIDGICLDDTSLGQYGRVITMGYIYYQEGTYKEWFTICHDNNVFEEGSRFGIDLNNDGKFTVNVTPAILRCRSKSDVNSVFEIIE